MTAFTGNMASKVFEFESGELGKLHYRQSDEEIIQNRATDDRMSGAGRVFLSKVRTRALACNIITSLCANGWRSLWTDGGRQPNSLA